MPLQRIIPKIFANRDKRLDATVIYPGGEFLGERFSIYRKTLVKGQMELLKNILMKNLKIGWERGKCPVTKNT